MKPSTTPIDWVKPGARPAVWVWITGVIAPERIAATATGWNDRGVVVEWNGLTGTLNTAVWRNAVTHRAPGADLRQAVGQPHFDR